MRYFLSVLPHLHPTYSENILKGRCAFSLIIFHYQLAIYAIKFFAWFVMPDEFTFTMDNRFLLTLFYCLILNAGFAQSGSIAGTVVDEAGQPLPGADIYLKALNR